MTEDLQLRAVARMLNDPLRETVHFMGPEPVVCGPGELLDALLSVEQALSALASNADPCCIALLSDDETECLGIATAIAELAKTLGFSAQLVRGEWGRWARAAKETRQDVRSVHVLAKVPPEEKAREGFNAIGGGLILVWPLTMAGAALLPSGIREIVLRPFADRLLDKSAQVIAEMANAIAEESRDVGNDADYSSLHSLSAEALLAACSDGSRLKSVDEARSAGRRLAEALRQQAAFRPGEALSAPDLNRALFPQPKRLPPNVRRLWVEGETDEKLMNVAARLLYQENPAGPGLLDGIVIESLGGVAKAESGLARCDRDVNLELFLFDHDAEGQRGAAKVVERGFKSATLSFQAAIGACDVEWVIEDLLSVACLDRFYCDNPELRPAREEIVHQPTLGRRLVVRGEDKGTLAAWMETRATLADVFGIVKQLREIRRRFAMREPEIEEPETGNARIGLRPHPWWFVHNSGVPSEHSTRAEAP